MSKEILIGQHKEWGNLYLKKHVRQGDSCWCFGHLENDKGHRCFKEFIEEFLSSNGKNPFTDTILFDEWLWVVLKLFRQAYGLDEAAKWYPGDHGILPVDGSRTNVLSDKEHNKEMIKKINSDLEKILDRIWEYLEHLERAKESSRRFFMKDGEEVLVRREPNEDFTTVYFSEVLLDPLY